MLRRLALRLRAVVAKGRLEDEMQEEVRTHLERAERRLRARGMSAEEARWEARREFGNVALIEEQSRDARRARWLDALRGDLRFAVRFFGRRKLTTGIIVAVLALGIGVNTALMSLVQAFTLRPAPAVPRRADVMYLKAQAHPERDRPQQRDLSYPELLALRQRTETFAAVAAWTEDDVVLFRDATAPAKGVRIQFVTPEYFPTLGVQPSGPGMSPHDATSGAADVILSDALWDDLFGRAPDAIGQVMRINDTRVRVAGIAPPRFQGAVARPSLQYLWMRLDARPQVLGATNATLASADSTRFAAFARLVPGVTAEQATVVATGVAEQARAQMTPTRQPVTLSTALVPMRGAMVTTPDDPAFVLTLVALVPLLILLVACTNVSSLLVATAVARRHELAVRLSLGASRWRLVRQLVTETAMLAVSGGLLGLLLFWWITELVASRVSDVDLTPDVGTLVFTLVFAMGVGVLFGLSPALHATRSGVATALRDSGAGATQRSRLQGFFVASQVALTQPLLVILTVMLFAIAGEGLRFLDDTVAERVIRVRFGTARNDGVQADRARAIQQVSGRLREQPGVETVVPEAQMFALRRLVPRAGEGADGPKSVDGMRIHVEGAAPGYFRMLDVPIARGREMMWDDTSAAVVPVVVGSDLAREFWGDREPLGRHLDVADVAQGVTLGNVNAERGFVVVGVYDASHVTTRGSGSRIYTASARSWRNDVLLIRTADQAQGALPRIRAFLRDDATQLPIIGVETLAQVGRERRAEASQVLSGLAGAGAVALLLASIGLYGVVALSVGQRTREIGIRLALGGRPRRIVSMFFGSGMRLSAVGLAVGLPVSIVAMLFMRPLVPPAVLAPGAGAPTLIGASVAGVVIIVAAVAAWFPARRAAGVDPATVLRAE